MKYPLVSTDHKITFSFKDRKGAKNFFQDLSEMTRLDNFFESFDPDDRYNWVEEAMEYFLKPIVINEDKTCYFEFHYYSEINPERGFMESLFNKVKEEYDDFVEIKYYFISHESDLRGYFDSKNNYKVESISSLFRVAYEKLYWREIPIKFVNNIAYIGENEDVMILNKEVVDIECYDEKFENKIKGELWINFSNKIEHLELIKYNGHYYIDDWTLMEIELEEVWH